MVVKRINANVGDGPAIVRDYRLLGHPTLLFFNAQGQEVERWVGPQSQEVIEQALQQRISPE